MTDEVTERDMAFFSLLKGILPEGEREGFIE
jgi:hypothetical protein